MSNEWPMATLGTVLNRVERFEVRCDTETYTFAGTYSFARGIFVSGTKAGLDFKLPKVQRIRRGDFVYCKIMAWEGAFGLVPPDADNCVMSGAFVVYEVRSEKLDPKYLDYYFKLPAVWQSIGRQSTGTNVRRQSLDPLVFERTLMPLPPLAEQRRIVGRIEELAARIEEARGLRRAAAEDCERLLVAMAHRGDLDFDAKRVAGWREVAIGDVARFVQDPYSVDTAASYPNFGIYSFGRGLFPKVPIEGISTSASILYRAHKGQFIYSRLFAFEGAYGMVTDEFDGNFVSSEYPMFDCNPEQINADFLCAYFKAPEIWSKVAAGSKGLGDRRQRVQPAQVLAHQLWLPPLGWQQRIACVRARIDGLKQAGSETAAELDALLPSVLDKAFRGEL